MLLLINGPFGGGKTTTAETLVRRVPDSRLLDPEEIGFMLRHLLPDHPGDFQDLPPWRSLFATVAARVHAFTGQTLIAPMSVLRREYAEEILTGLRAEGLAVRRVLLHPDRDTLEARIAAHDVAPGRPEVNEEARAFRRSKVDPFYRAHREWLADWADLAVDNTDLSPSQVADRVLRRFPELTRNPP
ncbi:AAA family ATPase [Nocardiopsis prasina]|uniref:AAA family ATPase n=1 Tax=Nocardiopsis prasina TaxID=2015 RepID=UPI0003453579|nr:AAA family ATPase [Nocardiopsis prasina]